MDEARYHQISEDFINRLALILEALDEDGALEVEYQGGILTIELPSGKQLVISKHTASRQIWLASPASGGLHFAYQNGTWALADGRTLTQVLSQELKTLGELSVEFS
jgi:iron donor protein CyaY